MTVPGPLRQNGRARLAAIGALVLVFGIAGALLGPRLLHETAPSSIVGTGQVCVEFPPDPDAWQRGRVRITATRTRRGALDVATKLPDDAARLLETLETAAKAAGWTADDGVVVSGRCLSLGCVNEVGVEPGGTGVWFSLGLAATGTHPVALRIGWAGRHADPGPLMGVAFNAHAAADGDHEVTTADTALLSDRPAPEILASLRQRMESDGWMVEADGEDGIVVRALPGGAPLGSAMLTLSEGGLATHESTGGYWTLRLVP